MQRFCRQECKFFSHPYSPFLNWAQALNLICSPNATSNPPTPIDGPKCKLVSAFLRAHLRKDKKGAKPRNCPGRAADPDPVSGGGHAGFTTPFVAIARRPCRGPGRETCSLRGARPDWNDAQSQTISQRSRPQHSSRPGRAEHIGPEGHRAGEPEKASSRCRETP